MNNKKELVYSSSFLFVDGSVFPIVMYVCQMLCNIKGKDD